MIQTGDGDGDESDRIHEGVPSETAKVEPEKHEAKSQLAIYELLSSILIEWMVSRSLELYDSKNR